MNHPDERFTKLVELFAHETPFMLSADERAKWAAMHRVFDAVALLDRNSPSQNDLDNRRLTNADLMARSLEIESLWGT